jgi:tetratricopeptide (TPR) repeat protein
LKRPALIVLILTTGSLAPAPTRGQSQPSLALMRALKQYKNADYYGASVSLHEIIDGKTTASGAGRERAVFWMGKTLYHLGFYSASLAYFDRIVQKGGRYHLATLKWLAALGRKLPEPSWILQKIGKYRPSQLQHSSLQKVRDELLYLYGRFSYEQGSFKEAIKIFSSVPPGPFFVKARLMLGFTHVRLYQSKPAAAAFKGALRRIGSAPADPDQKRQQELAIISMARLFYSVKQYKESVKYYDLLPAGSIHRQNALFEQSWALFSGGDAARALKNLRVLESSARRSLAWPDATILEAVIHFKAGRRRHSSRALDLFFKRYRQLRSRLEQLLNNNRDSVDLFKVGLTIRGRRRGLGSTRERIRIELVKRQFDRSFAHVAELDRELKLLRAADPAWKAKGIAGIVMQNLTLQKALVQTDIGQMIRLRVKRICREIEELTKQGEAVRLELKTRRGGR